MKDRLHVFNSPFSMVRESRKTGCTNFDFEHEKKYEREKKSRTTHENFMTTNSEGFQKYIFAPIAISFLFFFKLSW